MHHVTNLLLFSTPGGTLLQYCLDCSNRIYQVMMCAQPPLSLYHNMSELHVTLFYNYNNIVVGKLVSLSSNQTQTSKGLSVAQEHDTKLICPCTVTSYNI